MDQPQIFVRPMQAGDVMAVMAIETEMYAFPWTRQIFLDCMRVGYHCIVAELHQEIVAYAIMSSGAGEAHLLNLCTLGKYQRHGFAEQLLQRVMEVAKSKKVETLFLEVRPSNHAALRLYEKSGFNQVGLRKDYYPTSSGREDALILAYSIL